MQNNNNLQMAMGNIMQAQLHSKKIQMGWLPTNRLVWAGWFTGQSFNPGFQNTSSYPLANNISQITHRILMVMQLGLCQTIP